MSDRLCYAIIDGVCYLKLSGELRHTEAGPLDALIERLFEAEPPLLRAFVIDLNDTSFMDSTMIGLLASIARELQRHRLPPATVFSTQAEINQLLKCLCLDQVFSIVEQRTDRRLSLTQLPAEAEDPRQTAHMILKAHEALMDLNECNRVAFQPVVDLFREQMGCGD